MQGKNEINIFFKMRLTLMKKEKKISLCEKVLNVYQINSHRGESELDFLSTMSFLARVVLRSFSQILFSSWNDERITMQQWGDQKTRRKIKGWKRLIETRGPTQVRGVREVQVAKGKTLKVGVELKKDDYDNLLLISLDEV